MRPKAEKVPSVQLHVGVGFEFPDPAPRRTMDYETDVMLLDL
jgi:hypothetical protein